MKRGLFSLFFVCIALISFGQGDTLRVLFLGNSYTGANNLPQITQNLSVSANKTLIIDSNTPGGHTIGGHSMNPSSLSKIRSGNWDFVVLQEQSQIPTIDFYRYNDMYPATVRLNDTVKKYNPCATVMMYMTWGRRFGGQQCDQTGTNCSPTFADFSHMQDSLEYAYVEIADSIDAYVSPVGIAWKKVIEDTTIVLHTADNSHPNYSGSYLAACVFYATLWKESPVGLNFLGSLSNSQASYLQTIADSIVFHSYSNWNQNVDRVVANYTYNIYGDSVKFINSSQSLLPVSYYWEFGDGSTSNLKNPHHIYTNNQSYTVSLIADYCSKRDTTVQIISINSVGLESIALKSSIRVYPNPVTSNLSLSIDRKNSNFDLQIISSTGAELATYNINNKQFEKINVAFLPNGLYFLKLHDRNTGEKASIKVLKK